jgi:hypothetical protein
MESVEGYPSQDRAGSDEPPWAAAPIAETPPTDDPDHAAGASVAAAEESLGLAFAEVDRVREELRAIATPQDRLRTRLEQAAAEADSLVTSVLDSYAREQTRLEAELMSLRRRDSGLKRIRETLLGIGIAEVPSIRNPAEPDPAAARFTVVPDPDPDPEPEPDSPSVMAAVSTPLSRVEGKKVDRDATKRTAETPHPTKMVEAGPITNQDLEGEDVAYEADWYQVLRRERSLGGEPAERSPAAWE